MPLLGDSRSMQALRRAIERVAASDASLLIQGENGTGKELVARSVHELGRRAEQPFVVVNCGGIPEALFESELFGHERGAFTGADRRRVGLFEAAHGGTLFLDELGELPATVQPALLRALQFGEVRPVGGERVRTVDARVLAATNRNLLEMVEQGAFREDLYYRIATLQIDVPPLRERLGDIRLLATTFLARSAARLGRRITFEEAALQRLAEHLWPGNVRELENAAERLAVMVEGAVIDAELVERHVLVRRPTRGELPSLRLEELEKLAIVAALRRHGGDKKAAAAELGIAFKTLYNKLDRYGLRNPSEEQNASAQPKGDA
jgi:DNA-binding NtrC family response regulator